MGKWKREKRAEGARGRDPDRQREVSEGARGERLQELIRQEVNFLLRNEIRDPRLGGVVATMVQLARDGSCARIWFSADDDSHDAGEALERAAGFLRSQLAESLALKRTPELRFRRDPATRALTPELPAEDSDAF
jgi:ribosome-binding factor A